MFITFEGPEGCGKSTHSRKLKAFLQEHGYSVLLTHEPGGTELGKQIRGILLNSKEQLAPYCELFLFFADRVQHVETVIKPALDEGKIVICDRYIDSTYAYQIGARGLSPQLVDKLNLFSASQLLPELTILLDLPVEEGLKRAATKYNNNDRFESEQITFHEKVRKSYLEKAKEEKNRFVVFDSTKTEKEVYGLIKETVSKKLGIDK